MGLSTYIWRGGDISPQEFPAPMMHSLSGDLLFYQKKRGICGYVTISPQGFPAPMMHCTMRRPSFVHTKEGKMCLRSALRIPALVRETWDVSSHSRVQTKCEHSCPNIRRLANGSSTAIAYEISRCLYSSNIDARCSHNWI